MKHNIERDWKRIVDVWEKAKTKRAIPEATFSISIYNLRKLDRGIDYPLRRLLDSEEYGQKIDTYGAPTHAFGRHPFRWNSSSYHGGKVWHSIRVKTE